MRYRLAILVGLMVTAATQASAQEWARKMFETTSHDFGAVARGSKQEFSFRLRNIYKETIHISGVRSTCGCTTPKITEDTLETYESGSIVAVLNTRSFLGAKSATITVTIDEPVFLRGDADTDGVFNGLIDALFILRLGFLPGPLPTCFDASDANDDGVFNALLDSIYLLNFQFRPGSPAPPAPRPTGHNRVRAPCAPPSPAAFR